MRNSLTKLIRLAPALLLLVPLLLACGARTSPHKISSKFSPVFPGYTSPLLSDFDGDNKLDEAQLSSNGRYKSISVRLGSPSWKSLSFDSGFSERGSLISSDIDSDGDADLIWISQTDPQKLVIWLGDGRGEFSIVNESESYFSRVQALLRNESGARVTGDSDDRDAACVPLTYVSMSLDGGTDEPHIVSSKRLPHISPERALRLRCLSIVRKRGPPSKLA
jgi:hypothetical protein